MDVSSMLTVRPAPLAVLDQLPTHRHRVRFHVRSGDAWHPVTWGQYALQIRGVARWLVEHEIEPGDRIAIFAANSVAWASACLGIQTAGAVFVPIYPASTPDQVAYILEHSDAKYLRRRGAEGQAPCDGPGDRKPRFCRGAQQRGALRSREVGPLAPRAAERGGSDRHGHRDRDCRHAGRRRGDRDGLQRSGSWEADGRRHPPP